MAKDTVIPIKFERELTEEEIEAFVNHISDFGEALKMKTTFISLSAVKNRVSENNSHESSGLHLADVVGSALLNDLLNNQEEIISSPIRFNGVHVNRIVSCFEKYGIKRPEHF